MQLTQRQAQHDPIDLEQTESFGAEHFGQTDSVGDGNERNNVDESDESDLRRRMSTDVLERRVQRSIAEEEMAVVQIHWQLRRGHIHEHFAHAVRFPLHSAGVHQSIGGGEIPFTVHDNQRSQRGETCRIIAGRRHVPNSNSSSRFDTGVQSIEFSLRLILKARIEIELELETRLRAHFEPFQYTYELCVFSCSSLHPDRNFFHSLL